MSAALNTGAGTAGQISAPVDDTLTFTVGSQTITGWTGVRVTAGCEQVPRVFDISMTDRFGQTGPGQTGALPPAATVQAPPFAAVQLATPGSPCSVKIGADLVVTGYIDRYEPSITPRAHIIRLVGRGKCMDLTDCSAGIKPDGTSNGMQVTTSSLLALTNQFAGPFGITASVVGGTDVTLQTPTGGGPVLAINFQITLTESPMQIIEEVARYARVLSYDGADGNLIFSKVGATKMASGFQQGVNVQEASAIWSMDQRYSMYVPVLTSQDTLSQIGNVFANSNPVKDIGVLRFRPLIVASEQTVFGIPLADARALWELTRRWGRSQVVRLICDSWRDSAGKLWQPNAIAPVNIPALGVVSQNWVISSVTFIRDLTSGQTAEVLLMPKDAFSLEPSTLQPADYQIYQDLHANDGAKPNWDPVNLGPLK